MNAWSYKEYAANFSDFEKKNAPSELFLAGDFALLTQGSRVSVVGSRKASNAGVQRAKIFTEALVKRNIIVVSGLAQGVDTVAHETAIKNGGRTIAVLGTPLNQAYPISNKQLLKTIKKDHLAISQFYEGITYGKSSFPLRNKTMALISDATVIIEAEENSGTQYQGWEALRLGRMLFIMQNVVEDNTLSWPKQMIEYGAQVLTRENMDEMLDDMPRFTAIVDFTF